MVLVEDAEGDDFLGAVGAVEAVDAVGSGEGGLFMMSKNKKK